MKNLNNILQFSIIYILLIVSLGFVIYKNNSEINSKYNLKTNKITGIITSYSIDGNRLKLYIKAQENLYGVYYIKSKNEKKELSKLKLGSKIIINGSFRVPTNNSVFHLFNYKYYLLSKKIYYIVDIESYRIDPSNIKFYYKLKNNIIKYINRFNSKKYLKTFVLGDNSDIDLEISNNYKNIGISHLLAISGMHITLLSSLLLFTLNKISRYKKTNYFLIFIILFIYMFLTNFSPSVIRAVLLFYVLSINKIFKIGISTINLYLLVLSIVLLINPYIIYSVAFKYSYVISFYLITFNKIIERFKNYFIKILVTSLISFIVSIPITINTSFQINLLSPIINIIFVPLVSLLIFPLSLITLVIPKLDNLLVIFTNLMQNLSLLIGKYNIIITMRYLNLFNFIFYYIMITIILICFLYKKYYSILFLILQIMIFYVLNSFNSSNRVTFIDVGQGDSSLISLKNNGGNILIDTGGKIKYKIEKWKESKRKYDLANDTIIPYLKSEGVNKLNFLILSHGDFDHIGEAIKLVNNFKVDKVIFNCGEYNDLEKDLIKVLDKKKIKYYSCIKELNIDKNKLYFLQTKVYDNENDNSNVIYTKLDGYKFMFMGDASITTEKEILSKYNLPDIDVLKVGHHGSKTSSSNEFINEINPKYSIISVGKNNRYGHPNKEVLDNLDNSKIYRTDEDGSIMFTVKNNKLKIETCSP